ncbi:MAG TPA: dihydropteroate synthase [Hyphomicrobiales bacterium]|nr:dihydropteroate synthase [Kaistiaceae bacterium]HQF29881.1 dihydropteroate synthase [Hyphomicrobiales bacterium]
MGDTLRLGRMRHQVGARTLVMGILNVTPDSFSDGGLHDTIDAAVDHALVMLAEGADIIDIGGESTRPGATEVAAPDEAARVVPVVERLAGMVDQPISIDTYKAAVADAALRAGATIVNDVWGLQRDPAMAATVALHEASLIIMHNRAEADAGLDMLDEVKAFFDRSLDLAHAAGIAEDRIVLDPGIGFGKTLEQNVELVARLDELKAIGFPILIGVSRKSMIGRILDRPVEERLYGTIAANVLSIVAGADIVRVHDVAAHVDACRITEAVMRRRNG